MIGTEYWSTGITVWCIGRDEWFAEAQFFDDGFAQDGSSEGVIRARYAGPLPVVVDTVKTDTERLGIRWQSVCGIASLYYRGDGERDDIPKPPSDWRERLAAEATRLGWENIYKPQEATT